MKLSLDELGLIYPDQLFLEFSQEEREKTWQQIQSQSYTNAAACWHAYLNCLCLNTFLAYLEDDPDLATPKVWPRQADLWGFWQVVNGTAIELENIRLVLIPSENSGGDELRVPREWVDLPTWAGNYYLAVELNLEERWMRIWGYATHQQLRQEGRYDRMDETYSLEVQELMEDLTVMWTVQELYPSRIEVKPIPTLSSDRAEALLEQLSKQSLCSPRLDVPFVQWGALMEDDRWRRMLYERSQRQLEEARMTPATTTSKAAINLGQWFGQLFEAGWQSLDALLNTESELALAYSFRQGQSRKVPIEGVKLIDLGMQLGNQSVALLIGLTPESDRGRRSSASPAFARRGTDDQRVSVRVQLHPAAGQTYLPSNIKLVLLSSSGTVLQEFEARSQDNFIQLKRFTCPVGKRFSIQVALEEFSLTEDFVIEE